MRSKSGSVMLGYETGSGMCHRVAYHPCRSPADPVPSFCCRRPSTRIDPPHSGEAIVGQNSEPRTQERIPPSLTRSFTHPLHPTILPNTFTHISEPLIPVFDIPSHIPQRPLHPLNLHPEEPWTCISLTSRFCARRNIDSIRLPAVGGLKRGARGGL